MEKEIHYVLTWATTKVISIENLKTVLFLLSWAIPIRTDCRTPNFGYAFNSSLVNDNENKNQLINYNRLCHRTGANLLMSPESSSFFIW